MGAQWYVAAVLTCISLMASDVEPLHVFTSCSLSSWRNTHSRQPFARFLTGPFRCCGGVGGALYVLGGRPFLGRKHFLPSCAPPSPSATCALGCTHTSHLVMSSLPAASFVACTVSVVAKDSLPSPASGTSSPMLSSKLTGFLKKYRPQVSRPACWADAPLTQENIVSDFSQ